MGRAVAMLVMVIVGAIVVPVAGPPPRGTGAAPPTTFANPAIDDATADPFVVEWAQRSYAYVAGRDRPVHENVPAYVTGDLARWQPVGDVLPDDRVGAWMATGAADRISSPAVAAYPDNPAGARFVLWFTATDARSGRRCVGAATAADPTGPFDAADEPLLCPPGGARDPSPVSGAGGGGPVQLLFRRDGGRSGIYAQRLAPDGLAPALDPAAPLLLDDAAGRTARPSLVRTAGDEALLLFTSTAPTAPTEGAPRSVGRARCTLGRSSGLDGGGATDAAAELAPAGPPAGGPGEAGPGGAGSSLPGAEDGTLVTACTPVPGGRQWVVGNEAVESPGAPQVFGEATDRWIVYDAYGPGACATGVCTGERRMHVDKLCLDSRPPAPSATDATAARGDVGEVGEVGATGHEAASGDDGGPRTAAPGVGRQALGRQADCRSDVASGWVATWAAGMMPASSQFGAEAAGFADATLRQVVHTSVGGAAVRVRLSNRFGSGPLHVGRATVALAAEPAGSAAAVRPGSQRPLTFGGSATVAVPPGGDVVSDAVALDVPPDHDLAVSVWFPRPTGPPTGHLVALETSYVGAGDLVDDPGPGFGRAATTESAFFVSAVDVLVEEARGTVVLLGDSLTDGSGGVPDAEERWSDFVVDRLVADGPEGLGVVNVGIAGNALLPDVRSTSPSALERFDDDVLAQADVVTVVVLVGTNDLLGHRGIGSRDIVDGLRQLVARSRAAGVRVLGVTIPPLAGPVGAPTTAGAEQARRAVNARIRDGLGYDAVVDVDAALRDPDDPSRLDADHAWFGGLHPDASGHRAMADAVDLAQLVPRLLLAGQG